MIGTTRSIIESKRYGFIRVVGGRDDYFFHRDDFMGDWESLCDAHDSSNGVSVEFDEVKTPKGNRAANVRLTV